MAILVRSELASHCQLVCCSDRYVIVKWYDVLFVCVYMPWVQLIIRIVIVIH